MGRWVRLFSLLLFLALAGCSSFRLVGEADPEITSRINDYHLAATSFVLQAEKNAGAAEGRFDSAASKSFYAEQGGVLANLIVRAEAADLGTKCPTQFAEALFARIDQLALEDAALAVDRQNDLRGGTEAGCTVVIMRHLRQAHRSLELVHESEGVLRPPASTISLDLIYDAVRIALRNEQLKQ